MAAFRQTVTRALLKQIRGGTAFAAPPPPRRSAFTSGTTFAQGYGTRAGFDSAQTAAERRGELIKAKDEVIRNLEKERSKTDKILFGLLSFPAVVTAGYVLCYGH